MFHQGKMQEARAKLHHDMQHFVNEVTAEELDEIEAFKKFVLSKRGK